MVEVSFPGGGSMFLHAVISPLVFKQIRARNTYGGGSGDSGGIFYNLIECRNILSIIPNHQLK
jgi:hypothetical protein